MKLSEFIDSRIESSDDVCIMTLGRDVLYEGRATFIPYFLATKFDFFAAEMTKDQVFIFVI